MGEKAEGKEIHILDNEMDFTWHFLGVGFILKEMLIPTKHLGLFFRFFVENNFVRKLSCPIEAFQI